MSADNGIYIGVFPKTENIHNVQLHESDLDYRVIEGQAIENIYFQVPENMDVNPREVVSYYENAPNMTHDEAIKKAFEMESNILNSDFPILEYGVSNIYFKYPFNFYKLHEKDVVYSWDK